MRNIKQTLYKVVTAVSQNGCHFVSCSDILSVSLSVWTEKEESKRRTIGVSQFRSLAA